MVAKFKIDASMKIGILPVYFIILPNIYEPRVFAKPYAIIT